MLSNSWYDRLKWIAQIGLPGLGTFYTSLDAIYDLPQETQVVATIVALDTIMGLYLGLSSKQYNKSDSAHQGYLRQVGVDPDSGMPHLAATFTELPQDLLNRTSITLKVGEGPVDPQPPLAEH